MFPVSLTNGCVKLLEYFVQGLFGVFQYFGHSILHFVGCSCSLLLLLFTIFTRSLMGTYRDCQIFFFQANFVMDDSEIKRNWCCF